MEFMRKKLGQRGEIVLPKEWREELGLLPESEVEINKTGSGLVIIEPVKKDFRHLAGLFKTKTSKIKDPEKFEVDILELMYDL